MPIDCKALFDQAWIRVAAVPGIKKLAQTPMYVVQAEHLPRMMMTMDTDMPAWGDPRAGPPKYECTITFYFSLVIAGSFEDEDLIELNETMDMVETVLLTDPLFLKQVGGFPHMRRQNPNFSTIHETNVCELRQSISFLMHQVMFVPTIPDYFMTLGIIGRPAPQVPDETRPNPPPIFRIWETFGSALGIMAALEAPDSRVVYAPALKAARMQLVADAIDGDIASAYMELGTAGMAEVLVTISLANPSFTQNSGVITMNEMPKSGTALIAGIVVEGRIRDGAGTIVVSGLTVGQNSGADIILDFVDLQLGQSVYLSQARITHSP